MMTNEQIDSIIDPARRRIAGAERNASIINGAPLATAEELTRQQQLNLTDYKARGFRRIGGILANCERELRQVARGEPYYDEVPSPEAQELALRSWPLVAHLKVKALDEAERLEKGESQ